MQKQASKPSQDSAEQVDDVVVSEDSKRRTADLKKDLDDLLDDIDSVLEENAAAFVKQYTQKSGE